MCRAWDTRSTFPGVDGLDELQVGHDAAYRHEATDDGRDARLQHRALAFGDVAHEGLVLGKAQYQEAVSHLDRTAGGDERSVGGVGADGRYDLRPGRSDDGDVVGPGSRLSAGHRPRGRLAGSPIGLGCS